ncbi:MAG: Gfo/Idh/MocA family oxidoreductase [Micropruina sp.]|nr:Gfo/Idh/MocA family oxidoreductase [Micropruina sp.]
MESAIRWGILGAGGIAAIFTENLLAEGLPVQAVGARDGARARAFADRFGIPTAHQGYDALVADPEVDAIYVSTTHNFHAEHALLAIAAGKPVLVEKAFTVTAAEARRVADAARAAGVFAMEAMWTRFLPSTDFVRARIADGSIGEVRAVITDHSQHLNADPKGRLHNPDLAGGALLDLGVYNVSFALDLLGAPSEIVARGSLTRHRRGCRGVVHPDPRRRGALQRSHHDAQRRPVAGGGDRHRRLPRTRRCLLQLDDGAPLQRPAAAGRDLRARPHLARHALSGPRVAALRPRGTDRESAAHFGRFDRRDDGAGRAASPGGLRTAPGLILKS